MFSKKEVKAIAYILTYSSLYQGLPCTMPNCPHEMSMAETDDFNHSANGKMFQVIQT